jgi:hypothetical protein
MKQILICGAFLAVVMLWGCSGEGERPRPGDTVTPVLTTDLHWKAGQNGELRVHLQARNADGSSPRVLGFAGIPASANPIATITFYNAEQAGSPVDLVLDHRC